jgi:LPXTG-motif cell wall-anchored protein
MTKVGAHGDEPALIGSLLMVGSLGIGGLAFLRRRKSDPQEKAEEQDKV